MSIGDKIADSADKAAHKIAETTEKVTEKIGDKVRHHDDADTPTGTHRGQPAPEDNQPGLMDKLGDAAERVGNKIEEMTHRDDDTDKAPAPGTIPSPSAPRHLDPTGKIKPV